MADSDNKVPTDSDIYIVQSLYTMLYIQGPSTNFRVGPYHLGHLCLNGLNDEIHDLSQFACKEPVLHRMAFGPSAGLQRVMWQ